MTIDGIGIRIWLLCTSVHAMRKAVVRRGGTWRSLMCLLIAVNDSYGHSVLLMPVLSSCARVLAMETEDENQINGEFTDDRTHLALCLDGIIVVTFM